MKHLKLFNNHNDYNTDIATAELPNVSYCIVQDEVHYNPYVPETRLVLKYNVTSTSSTTKLMRDDDPTRGQFSDMEIDGVMQQSVVSYYQFSTTGEHTVKLSLVDTTQIRYRSFRDVPDLSEAILPSGITTTNTYTFHNTGLTKIVLPSTITTLGGGVFNGCSNLTSITCLSTTAPTIYSNTFGESGSNALGSDGTLYVPSGSTGYDDWMSTDNYYLGKYNWTKVEQ